MKYLISLLIMSVLCADAFVGASQTPAADNIDAYLPLLKNKKVGLTVNHTARVGKEHLLDVLLKNGIEAVRIYAPEHGFRGTAGAGETVDHSKDEKTGIPIVSLYGNNKKPSPEQLKAIDCMVFDMQDVGTRFFTYLSTLHYVMEACAESSKELIVLDRPNPNGFYIDGPVLDTAGYRSFVGLHPIPVVHGLTLGEIALMINGEGWLAGKSKCRLTVIPCSDYTHKSKYALPLRPSPNLPDMQAVYLYPSLCFFEGTPMSVGRGTEFPFKVFGHPSFKGKSKYPFAFVPQSKDGKLEPLFEGKTCYGQDLRTIDVDDFVRDGLNLDLLIASYQDYKDKTDYFKRTFTLLSGNKTLKEQIIAGKSAREIKDSWKDELERFKKIRKKYLLYADFE
ncbi:MAG: DUF1343 domain-containing protein [Prevotellaceae bacterium]|jgi:uncharacterized protein YbbC (DUF1343 family)|nr:DUF1343 domain-containing protein [Prevotellaceae bacterium]